MKHSEGINELATALAKARSQFKKVEKASENPFFHSKYADLSVIIDATHKALSDNGLSIIQSARGLDLPLDSESIHRIVVTTLLIHSSGQWFEDDISMPTNKIDAQAIGSATTYARRYAYQSMLNIAAETDDDGNEAVSQPFKKRTKEEVHEETNEEFDQRTEGQRRVGSAIAEAFIEFAKQKGIQHQSIMEHTNGTVVADLTRDELGELKTWVMSQARGNTADIPQATAPTTAKTITQPQIKRMFAIAHSHNVASADVETYVHENYNCKIPELNRAQYDHIVRWIEAQK